MPKKADKNITKVIKDKKASTEKSSDSTEKLQKVEATLNTP